MPFVCSSLYYFTYNLRLVWFDILTALMINFTFFWDMRPCWLVTCY